MPDTSMPPLPPSVTAQQQPDPAMAFAMNAGAQGNANAMQFDSLAYAESELNKVAEILKGVAQVIVNEIPSVMPILQKMGQAGSALVSEIQSSRSQAMGSNPNLAPTQAQLPEAEGAGAVSMS